MRQKKPAAPGSVQYMIERIRDAVIECTAPEYDCYDALTDEASGWEIRFKQLEAEKEDGE